MRSCRFSPPGQDFWRENVGAFPMTGTLYREFLRRPEPFQNPLTRSEDRTLHPVSHHSVLRALCVLCERNRFDAGLLKGAQARFIPPRAWTSHEACGCGESRPPVARSSDQDITPRFPSIFSCPPAFLIKNSPQPQPPWPGYSTSFGDDPPLLFFRI